MYLASNLRYLRSQNGWKQADVAKRIGKTSAAISEYEKGKSLPPLDVAYQISRLFNVSVDELFSKDLQKARISAEANPAVATEADYLARYAALQKQQQFQEHLIELQQQRVRELEREIREHAPELAKRLGL